MFHSFHNHPSAIIFSNTDLSANVQAAISRQLYLTEVMTGAEFDARVAGNPNYPAIIHLNNLRILVLRDLSDLTNRSLADLVLFFKAGLAYVLFHRTGAPGFTIPIDKMYLAELFVRDHIPDDCDDDDDFLDPDDDEFPGILGDEQEDDEEILPISEQIELRQLGGRPPCIIEQIENDRAADDFQSVTDLELEEEAFEPETGESD